MYMYHVEKGMGCNSLVHSLVLFDVGNAKEQWIHFY